MTSTSPESKPEPSVVASARVAVSGAMITHPGCVRDNNEDVVAYVLPDDGGELLAVVADGIGGQLAGEVASKIAADTMLRLYFGGEGSPADRLAAGMAAANHEIYKKSGSDAACAGMGTTCTVIAICNGAAFLAHIGDSRAYLWRDGTLRQVSDDHTLVAAMVRDGTLTEAEAANHPTRNILVQALGTHAECDPTIWREGVPVREGDRWLLCSDGLSDTVDAAVIAETIAKLPPAEACQVLIERSLAAGAPDNTSVGVFAVRGL
jgi:PPM family protein phosphatase